MRRERPAAEAQSGKRLASPFSPCQHNTMPPSTSARRPPRRHRRRKPPRRRADRHGDRRPRRRDDSTGDIRNGTAVSPAGVGQPDRARRRPRCGVARQRPTHVGLIIWLGTVGLHTAESADSGGTWPAGESGTVASAGHATPVAGRCSRRGSGRHPRAGSVQPADGSRLAGRPGKPTALIPGLITRSRKRCR
jgi:hypothetical protein